MIFIAHTNFLWVLAGVKFAAGHPKKTTNSGSRRSSIINHEISERILASLIKGVTTPTTPTTKQNVDPSVYYVYSRVKSISAFCLRELGDRVPCKGVVPYRAHNKNSCMQCTATVACSVTSHPSCHKFK
jgi:hypothetical protein